MNLFFLSFNLWTLNVTSLTQCPDPQPARSLLQVLRRSDVAWPVTEVEEDCQRQAERKMQRVALFVMWNHDINASVAKELSASYSPWFASVEHIGGNSPCNLDQDGWLMYQCYAEAAIRTVRRNVDGALFVADDSIFRPGELSLLGLTRLNNSWLPLVDLSDVRDLETTNWEPYADGANSRSGIGTGFTALRLMLSENTGLQVKLQELLGCAEPCVPYRGNGDILYLPHSQAFQFADLATLFRSYNIFTEVALPSMIALLGSMDSASRQDGRFVWSWHNGDTSINAIGNIMTAHPDLPMMLHPWKMSDERYLEAFHNWFHNERPCNQTRALSAELLDGLPLHDALQRAHDILQPAAEAAVNFREQALLPDGNSSFIEVAETKPYELKGLPRSCHGAKFWAVLTTINAAGRGVKRLDQLPEGWCVVVVGDKETPEGSDGYFPNATRVFFLSATEQQRLPLRSIAYTPWNHFTRKNIGYLVAAALGAEAIYDTDDDNILKPGSVPPNLQGLQHAKFVSGPHLGVNVYAAFNATEIYPRGLPLVAAAQPGAINYEGRLVNAENLVVQQSLVDGDPDVDAIVRMSHTLSQNVTWKQSNEPVVLQPWAAAPTNSQATTFLKRAFPTMFLPATVHPRVADIWRGYFSLPVLWQHNLSVAYVAPRVNQVRNSHKLTEDLAAEFQLYKKSGSLIKSLASQELKPFMEYDQDNFLRFREEGRLDLQELTISDAMQAVHVDAFRRGFIDESDLQRSQAFLDDLAHPPIIHVSD